MVILAALALFVSAVALATSLWSAMSARRSAEAATRSRADSLGPLVSVREVHPLRERWNYSPQGLPDSPLRYPPGVAPVERQFVRPQDLGIRLLVGAHLIVVNDGTLTTTVTISAFRADRCDDFDQVPAVLAPPAELPSTALPDGRLVLEASQRAGLIVRQGPTLEQWIANGDQPYVVEIAADTSPDGARQRWKLELSAEVLDRVYGNDAAYRVVPHRPPDFKLTELPRTYPQQSWLGFAPRSHRRATCPPATYGPAASDPLA